MPDAWPTISTWRSALAESPTRSRSIATATTDLRIETKPDLTLVTDADKAVEQALRERLAEARPDDP